MMHKRKIILFRILAAVVLSAAMYACANMASPSGGRYDEEPPVMRKSSPAIGELNVKKRKIEILFDENVKIEKPTEKVIITPPQQEFPVIKAIGKKVIVELEDDLLDNTTYIIDFTDAIVDNNEGNPLENFAVPFSTGNELDSLAVSGHVLTAENLEPVKGIYVGLHSNLNDTAFTHTRFERISMTDSRGKFTIKGIAKGKYKIFALKDSNRDYKYDNPQEEIAFNDSIIIPDFEPAVRQDTIYQDSLTIDTIKTVNYTRFFPDDIVLRSFLSDFKRQYLQKSDRPAHNKIELLFAAPTTLPKFNLINPSSKDSAWYVQERNATNDTITLWITDSLIHQSDSIRMQIEYLRTDSLDQHVWVTDTLKLDYDVLKEKEKKEKEKEKERKKEEKNKEEGEEKPEIQFLNIRTNIKKPHEIYQPITLEFEQPLQAFDTARIHLTYKKDSISEPVQFTIRHDSLNVRKYILTHKWEAGGNYTLEIDSAAYISHYGLWNNKLSEEFSIKKLEEYGNLAFTLSGLPKGKTVYVELLDKSDKPFRKEKVKDNEVLFWDLNPGVIYARAFVDDNEDGEWTTGDYEKKREPEQVFYYPRAYEIRAYTDHEEPWNVRAVPLTKQKPADITKNKPEEKKRRNLNQQNQERERNNSQNQGMQGLGNMRRAISR